MSTRSRNYYFVSILSLGKHIYGYTPIIIATSVSTNVSMWRHSTSSLRRFLYDYAPTVVSTYISM